MDEGRARRREGEGDDLMDVEKEGAEAIAKMIEMDKAIVADDLQA